MEQVRLVVVLAAVALAAALFGAGPASCEEVPDKQPRIEVSPVTFDFGEVKEGEKPSVKFTLKNAGNADLIIYDAKPSCGCTVANLSSKKLAPGETATLETIYNSHNASGKVHKFVDVRSNDPKTPSVNLAITGEVKAEPAPDIMLNAFNASDMRLAPGATATRSVKVSNPGQIDLTIAEMTTSKGIAAKLDRFLASPGETVKPNMVIRPGEARVLDITITPSVTKGSFQEIVTIRSNSKRRPSVSFVAQGIVE